MVWLSERAAHPSGPFVYGSLALARDDPALRSGSLVTIDDPSPRQIIRREDHADPITLQHPDLELAHLAGRIRQDLVTVLQHDAIISIRQHLGYHPLHLDTFFFGHPVLSRRSAGPRCPPLKSRRILPLHHAEST